MRTPGPKLLVTQRLCGKLCVVSNSCRNANASKCFYIVARGSFIASHHRFQAAFERQLFAQIFFVSSCAGLAAAFLACSFKDVA